MGYAEKKVKHWLRNSFSKTSHLQISLFDGIVVFDVNEIWPEKCFQFVETLKKGRWLVVMLIRVI